MKLGLHHMSSPIAVWCMGQLRDAAVAKCKAHTYVMTVQGEQLVFFSVTSYLYSFVTGGTRAYRSRTFAWHERARDWNAATSASRLQWSLINVVRGDSELASLNSVRQQHPWARR